jgi:hypothetical protein
MAKRQSALLSKADICIALAHVRLGPDSRAAKSKLESLRSFPC